MEQRTPIKIRNVQSTDSKYIQSVVDVWWGRKLSHLLPHLFFDHFQNTSWVVMDKDPHTNEEVIVAFLIGFISQSLPNEAYIHFVGVHPEYRKSNLARFLYNRFFDTVSKQGVTRVRSITSPVNRTSIAFHTKMGFKMEGDTFTEDGIPYYKDVDAKGAHAVSFVKELGKAKL